MDELTPYDIRKYQAYYIYNILLITTIDYDKQYNELFKNALKYGMSKEDFWNGGDWKDYFIYEEAYLERLHEQNHIQGYYNFIAFSVVMSNAFMDKKKVHKPQEYPINNIYQESKEKLTKAVKLTNKGNVKLNKDNLQKVYMNRLANCY